VSDANADEIIIAAQIRRQHFIRASLNLLLDDGKIILLDSELVIRVVVLICGLNYCA